MAAQISKEQLDKANAYIEAGKCDGDLAIIAAVKERMKDGTESFVHIACSGITIFAARSVELPATPLKQSQAAIRILSEAILDK